MKFIKKVKNILFDELNPVVQVLVIFPVYIITLYRSYNFEINADSVSYTVLILLISGIYLYINRYKI